MLLRSGRNVSETAFSGAPRQEEYHYPVVAFPPGSDGKHLHPSALPVVKPFLCERCLADGPLAGKETKPTTPLRFPSRLALLCWRSVVATRT